MRGSLESFGDSFHHRKFSKTCPGHFLVHPSCSSVAQALAGCRVPRPSSFRHSLSTAELSDANNRFIHIYTYLYHQFYTLGLTVPARERFILYMKLCLTYCFHTTSHFTNNLSQQILVFINGSFKAGPIPISSGTCQHGAAPGAHGCH